MHSNQWNIDGNGAYDWFITIQSLPMVSAQAINTSAQDSNTIQELINIVKWLLEFEV